jgi:hypothetical protein
MSASPCPFRTGQAWNSFQRQERKLADSASYVALHPSNLSTWGEGYADLLRSVGDDLDSFFREMAYCPARKCRYLPASLAGLTPTKPVKDWTIEDFRKTFEPIYELSENEVTVLSGNSEGIVRKPFDKFESAVPAWWTSYNHIKHQYYEKMQEGRLANVLDALCALVILSGLHRCSQEHLAKIGVLAGGVKHQSLEQRVNPDYLFGALRRSAIGIPQSKSDIVSVRARTRMFYMELRRDKAT